VRGSKLWLGLAVLALGAAPAWGQFAVYGEATGANLQFPNSHNMYGSTFGLYYTKRFGPITAGPDFRGAMIKRGGNNGQFTDQALDSGQFGARFAAAPGAIPFLKSAMPYAEATAGIAYWRGGIGPARQEATHGMLQLIGGLDYKLVHHISWRVIEFTYGRAGATPGNINPETLSTGIVINVP
jgi:hypothetical protein